VEDDPEMRQMLSQLLEADGYRVRAVASCSEALAAVASEEPALVLLDVVLGHEDGRALLPELRLLSDAPVVFLTGRGLETDRIAGLRMGADDYVVKPFSPGELTARIGSVLRRCHPPQPAARSVGDGLWFGDLRIDRRSREVECAGQLIDLTAKEFDLLVFLAESPRQVFSRQQLLEHVWSSSGDWQDEATVTEHVHRLRRKINGGSDGSARIVTIRGVGYRFEPGGARTAEVSQISVAV
jgi:two-component system, OmpR family, phosphate regulon response regulator PhoB